MFDSLTTSDLIVPSIIAAGGALIFLILMLVAVAQWMKVAVARRWPAVPGVVVESRVVEARDSRGGWYTYPLITYQYAVGGQKYQNNVITFGERDVKSGTEAAKIKARQTVSKYTEGSPVEVRHHPKRPNESVLEFRAGSAKYAVIGGVVFLLAGLLVAAMVLVLNAAG